MYKRNHGQLDEACRCARLVLDEIVGAICEKPGRSYFVCAGCARLMPWCWGADDNMPEHCDRCWVKPPEPLSPQLELQF